MKHCAKKLLGLAFALALCLAVGGTALAQTPEFADVLAALPEQEMLAYEPNVAMAEDTTTIGDIATNGYQVTIPTTVTVKSGENKGELEVNAKLKQYRTLNIGIESQNDWKLQYDGAAAGATTPEVDYKLSQGTSDGANTDCEWEYQPEGKKLSFSTTKMQPGASLEADMERLGSSSYKLPITVLTPSQATMSGTYSDTLTFTFNMEKQCVTYTINVYHQEMQLTGNHFSGADNAPNYQALKMVDQVGTDGSPIGDAQPDEVYTLEYGFANGKPAGSPPDTWTRPRMGHSVPEDEDTRCWEDLTYALDLQQNYDNGNKDIAVNLNLVRKWCWLDVNGITDKVNCADCSKDGNQGGRIASFVNIRVSADGGTNWSRWYWYSKGDDYWGTFPYGTEFQLGLHRVKDGYAYDEETSGVAIYANGSLEYTQSPDTSPDGRTHYRVYQGKLEGEPVDATLHNTNEGGNVHEGAGGKALPRYCYNVCFVDGITYYANDGTGGREDTNLYHGPHTTFQYTAGMTLAEPETTDGCDFTAPKGKSFAGWSTTPEYTAGQPLYDANVDVSSVEWPVRPSTSHNDTLPDKDGQTVCRTLYAIWGYDITVQFEDETGYTEDGTSTPVLGGLMTGYSFTLEGQAVEKGKDWTLNLDDPDVKKAIEKASEAAKGDTWIKDATDNETETGDELAKKIWKIGSHTEGSHTFDFTKECTISAEKLESGTRTLTNQRRRYLLSVISADADTDNVHGIATNPDEQEYGTFAVTVNGVDKVYNTSFYQCGLNYGAKYEIKDVTAKEGYNPKAYMVFKLSLKKGTMPEQDGYQAGAAIPKRMGEAYSGFMTAKKENIHYYTNGGNSSTDIYTGDPVRIGFTNLVSSSKPGSTTPMPGPSLTPAKKALTLRYHANFDPTEELALDLDPDPLLEDMDDTFGFDPDPLPEDVDDALEEAVKTVRYQPGEDVVLRNCMFKRGGYVFVGWNTEPDGTGRLYRVNGVPVTDWADGDTVDLYAQWKKPEHLKPVVDNEPFVPTDPDTPPERVDDGFDADFGADPDPLPEGMDDAFGVDPAAQPEALDDAFGIDPDPLPEELDDAFGV